MNFTNETKGDAAVIDQRNRLEEEPFTYRILKDDKLQIYFENKPIMLLKGSSSKEIIEKLNRAETILEEQLVLAKITGQFKHGNEKTSKHSNKYK